MKKLAHAFLLMSLVGTLFHCGGGSSDSRNNSKPVPEQPDPALSFSDTMTTAEMREYLAYDPLAAYRCSFPDEKTFTSVADSLGGFARPYQVPVQENETDPRILSGFESFDMVEEDVASYSTSIERPDLVGQSGSQALYLSATLGLFVVTIDEKNPRESSLSCSATLPGTPLNFILTGNELLVFVNSLDGLQGGVLKYILRGSTLTFQSGLILENKPIVDARLFDSTLAVYSADYSAESNGDDYALSIISSVESLTLVSQDNLVYEETIDGYGIAFHWSRYNGFVSASDDYLVISRTDNQKVLDHYETRLFSYCTAWEERTREVCRVIWEKVENPDYVDYDSPTVSCDGSLLECLNETGPTLSRYLYVNAGTACEEVAYQACTKTKTSKITYPVYNDVVTTQFTIYRYQEGNFVRLDDTLSVVDGENFTVTELPIEVSGQVNEHSWLYFNDGFFYSLTDANQLTTFAIQGNSVIRTNVLGGIGGTGETVSAAQYSPGKIFVNTTEEESYRDIIDMSSLHAISLSNPAIPALAGELILAGDLDQLFVTDNHLLAFGSTFYGVGSTRHTIGTINLFEPDGTELDALLLGIDYPSYWTSAASYDQVAHFDEGIGRFILPYTSSGFVDGIGYSTEYRLILADMATDHLEERITFNLSHGMKRSLSFLENLAITFSDYSIHLLYEDEAWEAIPLLDARLPRAVYEAVEGTYWIRVTSLDDSWSVAVAAEDDIFSATPIDQLDVAKASSHVCFAEQIHFFDNGLLIVSEVPGRYTTREDCPGFSETEMTFKGWHVDGSGNWVETDSATLQTTYELIVADYQCVVDTDNFEGVELDQSEVPDGATCYTRQEYDAIRYEHY